MLLPKYHVCHISFYEKKENEEPQIHQQGPSETLRPSGTIERFGTGFLRGVYFAAVFTGFIEAIRCPCLNGEFGQFWRCMHM